MITTSTHSNTISRANTYLAIRIPCEFDNVLIWVKYNLYANTNKCSLFVPEVKYLGHIISTNGISVHPSKLTGMVTPYLSY